MAFKRFFKDSSLIVFYLGKYRRLVWVGVLSLLFVDILEMLPPLILKKTIDEITGDEALSWVAFLAVAYISVAFFQAIGRYLWRVYLIRTSVLAGRDLRQTFVEKLFSLSASFFDQHRVGDLMSLATNDTEAVRRAIGFGMVIIVDAVFYFITISIAMWWLSPKLMILTFIPLIIVPFVVIYNEREIHRRFERVQDSFSKLSAMAQENLMGIRLVKAFAREDVQIKKFDRAGREYVDRNLRLARIQSSFGPTLDFIMSMGLVILLFHGGRGVIAGAITLGTFVAFQRYIQKLIWPMEAFGLAVTVYQRAVASSDRIKKILFESPLVTESPATQLPKGARQEINQVPGPWRTKGGVEFRGLSFLFPGNERRVLDGINLKIEPGERVAFMGTIGSGKSSLFSLIPRLYPVGDGMIFVDDVDINRWPVDELRRQIGYVSQDIYLFSERVAENIAFSLIDPSADTERDKYIEQAAQLSVVHQEILGLTHRYNTLLGDRGVNLSGGQKQRVTLARALLKKPSILIMDDALSAVDVETEKKILKGLSERPDRNTELISAHRISTIRDADRIVVLALGKITQVGKHAELLRDKIGLYARFYEQQRLKDELERYVEGLNV